MKTSNKILLGFFLTAVIILTSIHVAMYAKYKRGDFISVKQAEEERTETIPLPPVKYVSASGLGNMQLSGMYSFGASGRPELKVQRQANSRFSHRIVGDTLFLQGDSLATKEEYDKGLRNYQQMQLSIPVGCHVKVTYGSLALSGSFDSAHAPSFSVELTWFAHMGIAERYPSGSKTFFNRIDVVSNSSEVALDEGTILKQLNIKAQTSNLNLKQSGIGQLALDVDPVTTITVLGKNLKDINLTTPQP